MKLLKNLYNASKSLTMLIGILFLALFATFGLAQKPFYLSKTAQASLSQLTIGLMGYVMAITFMIFAVGSIIAKINEVRKIKNEKSNVPFLHRLLIWLLHN